MWADLDKQHLWHPFTQMKDWLSSDPIVIKKGRGNWLFDVYGKRYLDGVSSLWTNVHGHNHPHLNRAIKKQLNRVAHSTFLGLSNTVAIEFADKLMDVVPPNLKRLFYSDNGSTAVEIATKIAFQYWQQQADLSLHKKTKFIAFTNAYHGDTLGAVSLGGMELFHSIYELLLFKPLRLPFPYPLREGRTPQESEKRALAELEKVLNTQNHEIAGLIIEPLMQGAAGMVQSSRNYLRKVRELAHQNNVLMIVDEVATGFGRTGEMFACQKAGIEPDILCLAKGISGGYLPLAATLTTESIFEAFLGEHSDYKTFFHGHTYTANPLACAAGIASLEIFGKEQTLKKLQPKIKQLTEGLTNIAALQWVAEVRQEGFMVGIELTGFSPSEQMGTRVAAAATQRGVFLRPLGDVIVLMPPLSITSKELHLLLETTKACIISCCGH